MAGALNGQSWIPQSWLEPLENHTDTMGRDAILELATSLSELRCNDVGLFDA
eukprot:gene19104-25709_t